VQDDVEGRLARCPGGAGGGGQGPHLPRRDARRQLAVLAVELGHVLGLGGVQEGAVGVDDAQPVVAHPDRHGQGVQRRPQVVAFVRQHGAAVGQPGQRLLLGGDVTHPHQVGQGDAIVGDGADAGDAQAAQGVGAVGLVAGDDLEAVAVLA